MKEKTREIIHLNIEIINALYIIIIITLHFERKTK